MGAMNSAWAEGNTEGKNIQLSVIPFGYQNTVFNTNDNAKYDLFYGSKLGFSFGYEFAIGKSNSLLELTYTRSKFDSYDASGSNAMTARNVADFGDLSSFAFMYYWGRTIFPSRRFQMPFYFGIGTEVLQGYPFHTMMFDLGAKLRFKFYVSNRVGLFVGGTGKYGLGTTKLDDSGKKNDMHHHGTINFDAGISILIN